MAGLAVGSAISPAPHSRHFNDKGKCLLWLPSICVCGRLFVARSVSARRGVSHILTVLPAIHTGVVGCTHIPRASHRLLRPRVVDFPPLPWMPESHYCAAHEVPLEAPAGSKTIGEKSGDLRCIKHARRAKTCGRAVFAQVSWVVAHAAKECSVQALQIARGSQLPRVDTLAPLRLTCLCPVCACDGSCVFRRIDELHAGEDGGVSMLRSRSGV